MTAGFKLPENAAKIFGAGILAVIISTALTQLSGVELTPVFYIMDIVSAALVLSSIFYGLKTQDFLGGDFARYLSLIAIGIGSYGAVFHLVNMPYQEAGHPVVFGLSSSFWLASTHAMQIFGVSIATAGFYLLWRSSR